MKRTFAILLTLFLVMVALSGCQTDANGNNGTAEPEQSDNGDAAASENTMETGDTDTASTAAQVTSDREDPEPASAVNAAAQEQDDNLWTVQTKYFSVQVPKSWEEICTVEQDDMCISFTHIKSYDAGYGGHLFTIRLFSVDDPLAYQIPESEILGGVGIPGLGEYNVWKICPSDVQFSPENYEEFAKCTDAIPEIVSTLSFNDDCYFSETPFETTFETGGTIDGGTMVGGDDYGGNAVSSLPAGVQDTLYYYEQMGYTVQSDSSYASVSNGQDKLVWYDGSEGMWYGSVDGMDLIDLQIIAGMDVQSYDGVYFETVGLYASAGYYGVWQLTSSGWTRVE